MLVDVTVDGMAEREFRRSIETMLRGGDADEAARRLRGLLARLCGEGQPLPARFLKVTARDLTVTGWNALNDRIEALDSPGAPITAIGIDISASCHGDAIPDQAGRLAPLIETTFYTDQPWPFSQCDRAQLLEGYKNGGSAWQGCFKDIDNTIAIEGMDDLYGAVIALEVDGRGANRNQAHEAHEAYVVGSSYLAVLIHQSVRDMALRGGLPRALAVVVGSNESFPFFDAPVVAALADAWGSDDCLLGLQFSDEREPLTQPAPEPEPEVAEDLGTALELNQLADDEPDPGDDPEAWHLPPPDIHVTGTQLRRRFVTAESIAEFEAMKKPSLLQRLLRRK